MEAEPRAALLGGGRTQVPKHVGIVGVSAEGAALCYRTLCVEGADLFGRHGHPEVTLHSYSLADYMRHIDAGDWPAVGERLLSSVTHLQKSGAELLICPNNTVHQAIDLVRHRSRCTSRKRWPRSRPGAGSGASWSSGPGT